MGMANAYAESVWNWWYTLLLPVMLAVVCYISMAGERKTGYYNLVTLPIGKRKLMMGKIIYMGCTVLASNAVIFAGAALGGVLLTTSVPQGGIGAYGCAAVGDTVVFVFEHTLWNSCRITGMSVSDGWRYDCRSDGEMVFFCFGGSYADFVSAASYTAKRYQSGGRKSAFGYGSNPCRHMPVCRMVYPCDAFVFKLV